MLFSNSSRPKSRPIVLEWFWIANSLKRISLNNITGNKSDRSVTIKNSNLGKKSHLSKKGQLFFLRRLVFFFDVFVEVELLLLVGVESFWEIVGGTSNTGIVK